MNSGIYAIENIANGKCYIGSSSRLEQRWIEHQRKLSCDRHYNRYLQRSWNKYGGDSFKFNILCYCNKRDLLLYEQRFLDILKPEYNWCLRANNTMGRKRTLEERAKMSEKAQAFYDRGGVTWNKGLTIDDPRVRRSGERCSVTKRRMYASGELIAWNKGKKMSPEFCEQARQGALRRPPISDETRRKLSVAGLRNSEKQSKAMSQRWEDGLFDTPQVRFKMGSSSRGKIMPDSIRQQISQTRKERFKLGMYKHYANNHFKKLTVEQVKAMREEYLSDTKGTTARKITYKYLAKKYNVHWSTIRNAIKRITWKDV